MVSIFARTSGFSECFSIIFIGCISEFELLRTFNCGVGAIVVVSPQNQDEVCKVLRSNVIGVIRARKPGTISKY